MSECDASIAELYRQKHEAIQSLERHNRTLQELQEKAPSEKVGSWGPRYCKTNVDAQGQDVGEELGPGGRVRRAGFLTPLCGGIRLGVLPHGRACSKNLSSWALSLQSTMAATIPEVRRLSRAHPPKPESSTLAVPVTPWAARFRRMASRRRPAPGPTQRTATSAFGVLLGPKSRSPKERGQVF